MSQGNVTIIKPSARRPVRDQLLLRTHLSPRGKVRRQDIFWDGWDLALEAVGLSE